MVVSLSKIVGIKTKFNELLQSKMKNTFFMVSTGYIYRQRERERERERIFEEH